MLDFDAGKLLIIGIVALLVIGPKELPRVLRQLGQWTGKLRRMASEFQGQFMDAMREADLESIKQDVANIAKSAEVHTDFNPVADINREMSAALEAKPAAATAAPAIESAGAATTAIEMPALPQPTEVAVLAEAGAAATQASESVTPPIAEPLPAHLRMPTADPAPAPIATVDGPAAGRAEAPLPFPEVAAVAKPPRVKPASIAARRNAALAAAARNRFGTPPPSPGERGGTTEKRDQLTST